MLFGDFFKGVIYVDAPVIRAMDLSWHEKIPRLACPWRCMASDCAVLAGSGRCAGRPTSSTWSSQRFLRPSWPSPRRLRRDHQVLESKYCVDWINENILARGARCLGYRPVEGWATRAMIDGAIVNGSWKVGRRVSLGGP